VTRVAIGEVSSIKRPKKKKSTVVSSKKKSTVMSPIRRQMKKRNPSSGQNGQLVHWWLLIHSGRGLVLAQGWKKDTIKFLKPICNPMFQHPTFINILTSMF
jgi:hypothetical protein